MMLSASPDARGSQDHPRTGWRIASRSNELPWALRTRMNETKDAGP
jgi:hypothetical protein